MRTVSLLTIDRRFKPMFERAINYRDTSSDVIYKLKMPEVVDVVTFYNKGNQTIFAVEVEENQKEAERLFMDEAISKGYSVFIAHAANWIISYTFYKNRMEENKPFLLSLVWEAYQKELCEWHKMEVEEKKQLEHE